MTSNEDLVCSVVVPAFNEELNVSRLFEELGPVLDSIGGAWEIIFVDDGSSDGTWKTIESIHQVDERVKGVRLSRNFGHQRALLAGLNHAQGAAVVSMDADMQHPPSLVPRLIEEWRAGNKIVKTQRQDPEDLPRFKKLTSAWFYGFFSWVSGVRIESGMADFRLIDIQVLREILEFREDGLFFRGIVEWVGYPSSTIAYPSATRYSGTTKYTLRKMIRLAWEGVSSFSLVPLRVGVFLGFAASALAFLSVGYAIVGKLIAGSAVPGWASLLATTSFLFGILFFYLGLLGEYLGRVLIEARDRPRYLVSQRLGTSE
jgi:dolichol-phosphate mannosyltransferase